MKALVLEQRCTADEVGPDVEEMRVLTITLPREDGWCFEQARLLARHLSDGPHATDSEMMLALVAESALAGTTGSDGSPIARAVP